MVGGRGLQPPDPPTVLTHARKARGWTNSRTLKSPEEVIPHERKSSDDQPCRKFSNEKHLAQHILELSAHH